MAATVAELARELGVHRATASDWVRAGAPRNADGSFDTDAVGRWRAERERMRGSKGDLAAWRTRRERATALRAERELAREGAKLIPRADVERMQVEWVDMLVTAIEAAPPKLTPLLVAARGHSEVEAILANYFRSLRVQLAAQCSLPVEPVVDDADDEGDP